MPMTTTQITVSGVDACLPVTLKFSNAAGFSVSTPALRATVNGAGVTLVAVVPLYLDPVTEQSDKAPFLWS